MSILANLGVIAGIVFLAIELRQNSEELAAQTRSDRVVNRQRFSELVLTNDGFLETLARVEAGEPLSSQDDLRMYYLGRYVLLGWQSAYRETQLGFIDEGAVDIDSWRNEFAGRGDVSSMADAFDRYKRYLDADFVEFVETNIVGHE